MNRMCLCLVVCTSILLATPFSAQAEKIEPPGDVVEAVPFGKGVELAGTLAPVGAVELSLEFEQYGGPLEVVECVKTGPVEPGQVVLRCSTEAIDKQIESAKLEMALAKTGFEITSAGHAGTVEELEMKLERAKRSYRIAKESLKRFEEVERTLRIDEAKQNLQTWIDRVADQREELAQLEKMYGEDDLTEETEEIVLKRARRGLKRAERSLAFRKIRHGWFLEESLPRDLEARQMELRKQTLALDTLKKTLELHKRKRDLELKKATLGMDRRKKSHAELLADRELLTLRAPVTGGVVIPGTFRGGRWHGLGDGETGYEAGDRVKARQVLFTVIDPKRLRVRATVGQADRAKLEVGMSAFVTCSAAAGATLPGTIERVADYSGDGKYGVWVRLGAGHRALRAGQGVRVGIVDATAPVRNVVSASSVVKDGDEHYVIVLGGPTGPERRVVEVQERMAGRVAIQGVKVDERVQLDPPAPKKRKKAKKSKKSGDKKDGDAKKKSPKDEK